MPTDKDFEAHLASCKQAVLDALAKQPHRAAPSFEDVAVACVAMMRHHMAPKDDADALKPAMAAEAQAAADEAARVRRQVIQQAEAQQAAQYVQQRANQTAQQSGTSALNEAPHTGTPGSASTSQVPPKTEDKPKPGV